MPKEKTTKEKLLESFENEFGLSGLFSNPVEWTDIKNDEYDRVKQFLSKAIDKTREETIREVLNKMRDVETKYTGDVFTDNMIDNALIDYHHKLKLLINK